MMKSFDFSGWELRSFSVNEKEWFCGIDILKIIQQTKSPKRFDFSRLELTTDHCKTYSSIAGNIPGAGNLKNVFFLDEEGVSLLLDAVAGKYPKEAEFRKWFDSEVVRYTVRVAQAPETKLSLQQPSDLDTALQDEMPQSASETDFSCKASKNDSEPRQAQTGINDFPKAESGSEAFKFDPERSQSPLAVRGTFEGKVYEFENHRITAVLCDGNPWFAGSDITEALGYVNGPKAIRDHVDPEEVRMVTVILETGKRNLPAEALFVSESGMYSLMLSSKLPAAKRFRNWVTKEVLPSIHAYGMYAVESLLNSPELAIKAFTALKEERDRNRMLEARIESDRPKVEFYDRMISCDDTFTTTSIAKEFDMSARKFNSLLRDMNVIYWSGDCWVLNGKYDGNGYTRFHISSSKDFGKMSLRWTGAGRKFIYDIFKENGILPSC